MPHAIYCSFSDFMEISEQVIKYVAILIMVIGGILLFIYLLDNITGGHLVKSIICGALYLIPFGSLFTALTQACIAIPA